MKKKTLMTRILAITGTILLWLPIAAMVIFTVARLIRGNRFMMDYLLPAELSPLVLVGAGLLLWAALRTKTLVKPVAWGGAILLASLMLGQGSAIATGLASGEHEFSGWRMILTLGLFTLYDLTVIFLGVTGIRLARSISTEEKLPEV